MGELQTLYEQDFSTWTMRTADLLRQGRFGELDIEHLVEELGEMGRAHRHELINRLRVLLAHLLKWQYQYRRLAERWAEFEGKSWRNTIIEQRAALRYLLEQNPGLQRVLPDCIREAYVQAIELAADETGLPCATFRRDCPYSQAQILGRDYYPPSE